MINREPREFYAVGHSDGRSGSSSRAACSRADWRVAGPTFTSGVAPGTLGLPDAPIPAAQTATAALTALVAAVRHRLQGLRAEAQGDRWACAPSTPSRCWAWDGASCCTVDGVQAGLQLHSSRATRPRCIENPPHLDPFPVHTNIAFLLPRGTSQRQEAASETYACAIICTSSSLPAGAY